MCLFQGDKMNQLHSHKQAAARVLVVEDETNVAEVLKARLESFGYTVCGVAASGNDAIHLAESSHPDIIMMDIKLNGDIDGIETADQIRLKHDIPIIYLTAFSDEHLLERVKITAPLGYIVKPYEGRELRIAIELALYKHNLDVERQHLIAELRKALSEVKRLSGLLPICASCKKIRDDQGYWNQVETYIQQHSEAQFTHSVCPECARKLYPTLGRNAKHKPGVRKLPTNKIKVGTGT